VRAAAAAGTDVAALAAFRFVLGALVCASGLRFLVFGWVPELWSEPTFFFTYLGFGWVRPLPSPGMHVVCAAMVALGATFAVGAFTRVVTPLLLAIFVYVQLVDVTNWLNHYYLVSLLLLLACFLPLGRAWSVDAARRPDLRLTAMPAWVTWLLRFQVAIVYFHAGIAKLSSDWLLHAQPLNIWLSSRTEFPIVGAFFDQRAAAYAFSWGGFVFDTTIWAFLLWRRSRPLAYVVVIAFHAMVGWLFPIGMFPLIMASSVLVFFPPAWPRAVLGRLGLARVAARLDGHVPPGTPIASPAPVASPAPAFTFPRGLGRAALIAYCAFQLLFPLRHRLYGGNVLWHEQGMRFSWKVMVRQKNGSVTYVVTSPKTGRTWYESPRRYLTSRQERELGGQPDLILQLAHHIAAEARARGEGDVEVRAEALVSLNGRPAAPLVDPRVDLARVEDGFAKAAWILPEPSAPPIHLTPLARPHAVAAR
jgi:hypothetical protein